MGVLLDSDPSESVSNDCDCFFDSNKINRILPFFCMFSPTWLGVGDAVSKELREHPEVLKDMYQNWPWFRTLIDLLEMVRNKQSICCFM